MKAQFIAFGRVAEGGVFYAREKTWLKTVKLKVFASGKKINAFEVCSDGTTVKIDSGTFFDDAALVRITPEAAMKLLPDYTNVLPLRT